MHVGIPLLGVGTALACCGPPSASLGPDFGFGGGRVEDAGCFAVGDGTAFVKQRPVLSDASGARILLVDDDPNVRRTLAEIMRAAGFIVETAPNGPAGLRAAANRTPDLILLDIMMPGLNGAEVARRIRADERTRVIPLIAISGVTEWLQAHRHASEPFETVLFKPVTAAQLMDTIANVLRKPSP